MIKLIATDMDGTLLDGNGNLPKNFGSTLQKLKEKNIKFVVASGRPYYTLKNNFGNYKEDLSYICENGALVIDNNKTIYTNHLNPESVKEIIKEVSTINSIAIVMCTKDCAYTKFVSEDHINEIKKYYHNLELVDNLEYFTDNILKIAICNVHSSSQNLVTKFKPMFESDEISVVGSGKFWIDFADKTVNKGNALKSLMNTYNASPEETMVFGDYYNDVEMLKQCKYSFVMKNAPEDMKQYGNYEADSNLNVGVLKAIDEYAL